MSAVARIRAATYNVHKCRGIDRRIRPDRIVKVIRQLDADVIAIQEILNVNSDEPELGQARYLAENLVGYQWCFGENRILRGGPYGNMTLSRHPIRFCHNYDVTWKKRERRGCLRTDISAGPVPVHVFNVHLGTGFLERRQQARRLLSADILHHEELRGPKIVAGDFNEWTRGLASRLMGSAFQDIDLRKFLRYRRTYPGVVPFLHLDHIYFDNRLHLQKFHLHRSREALIASDHLPIVADFSIRA
jgi:endonuclease/exonuclease/phosphatase family metal-dependent hydrolase